MKRLSLVVVALIAAFIAGFFAGLFYQGYEANSYRAEAIETARTNAVNETKKLYEGQIAELKAQVQQPKVPSTANAPTAQPAPSQMYLRAEQLRALSPAEAVSLLRQNLLWANISYDEKEEMIDLKSRDGSEGFIQYSRGRILFLRLTLPRKTAPPASALPMIGIQVPGPPTQTWHSGVRWESGFGVFKMVDAISGEKVTMLGVDYVEKSVIKQWEMEEPGYWEAKQRLEEIKGKFR
jgi:hypothetical protein